MLKLDILLELSRNVEEMGRGKHYTTTELKFIKILQNNGYTQKEISKIIKRSQKFVFSALKPQKNVNGQICAV